MPHRWSAEAVVAVDEGAKGVIFRGLALGPHRLYATDFHSGGVYVFDEHWRRIVRRGAFVDPKIPPWYTSFGITVADAHVFVTYAVARACERKRRVRRAAMSTSSTSKEGSSRASRRWAS